MPGRGFIDALAADEAAAFGVLTGAGHAGSLASWCRGRRFLALLFARGGSVLHLGCRNGLLLKCLDEWCDERLVLFGVDPDPVLVARAASLTGLGPPEPRLGGFAEGDPDGPLPRGMPKTFDHVYFHVPDETDFTDPRDAERVRSAVRLVAPGGRLVLGMFDPTPAEAERKVRRLVASGLVPSGRIENEGLRKSAVWFETGDRAGARGA